MIVRIRPSALVLLAAALVGGVSGCSGAGTPTPTPAPTNQVPATSAVLLVTSDAFAEGATIPERYTCRDGGEAPVLKWSGGPNGVAAWAVVVDDPDAPNGTFVHWVALDLPANATSLDNNAPPAGMHEATNSAGTRGWMAPCPPSGTHHYRFTVYALNAPTGQPDYAPWGDAIAAIDAHTITSVRLTGLVAG